MIRPRSRRKIFVVLLVVLGLVYYISTIFHIRPPPLVEEPVALVKLPITVPEPVLKVTKISDSPDHEWQLENFNKVSAASIAAKSTRSYPATNVDDFESTGEFAKICMQPKPLSQDASHNWLERTELSLQKKNSYECFKISPASIRHCLNSFDETQDYFQLTCCVKNLNENVRILNAEKFKEPVDIAITVIVHKRIEYLQEVIKSLSRTIDIGSVLLVVSHDGYFEDVDALIKSIKFCRVLQLYHPFSSSLVKSVVKRSVDQIRVLRQELTSSEFTYFDFNIHQADDFLSRDPRMSQVSPKHHYWWIWNYMFRKVLEENVQMLTLEEDHIVAPDIVILLRQWNIQMPELCPDCFSMSLGFHDAGIDAPVDVSKLGSAQYGAILNIGLVLNRKSFNVISDKLRFCHYNDYNWDLTMYWMQQQSFMPGTSLTPIISRVHHIGLCGMHSKSASCEINAILQKWNQNIVEPILQETLQYTLHFDSQSPWQSPAFTKRQELAPQEGWIYGRTCHRLGTGLYDVWITHVNIEHCVRLSTTDIGWINL